MGEMIKGAVLFPGTDRILLSSQWSLWVSFSISFGQKYNPADGMHSHLLEGFYESPMSNVYSWHHGRVTVS